MLIKNKVQNLGVAVIATLVGAAFFGSTAFAYGPERQTFTAENPADHVTFNSITNNPTVGDERNFVRVRQVGSAQFVDSVDIVPGQEYEVYVYYHNNAKSSLNSKENNYRGIALDAKLRTILPSKIAKGGTERVIAEITASNARPQKVWDESTLRSPSREVALRYIQGSAKITTKGSINGQAIYGESLLGSGVKLGFDGLNGILPGCDHYSGYITYRFKADYPDFETTKTVSKAGVNSFAKSQTVGINDEVEFKVTYKNTGTTLQSNVNIKDILPAGMTLVPGTTRITTPSDQTGKTLNDDISKAGINIGNYSAGGSATVVLRVKIDSSKLICGANTFTNTAQAITQNGGKSDSAKVVVQKNCTPQEKKEYCAIPGKGNLKKDDVNCSDKCKIPGLQHLSANDANCAEVPTELPHTGPAEAAMMVIAIMAITGAVAYWFRSREEMKKATAGLATKANDIVDHKATKTEAKKSEKVEKK